MAHTRLTLSLRQMDLTAIDQLAAALPLSNRHAVAVAALRFGLRQLVAEPRQLLGALRLQNVRFRGQHDF